MKRIFYLTLASLLPKIASAQIGFESAVETISTEVKGALKGLIVIILVFFAYKLFSKYQEEGDLANALKSVAGFGLLVLIVIGLLAFVIART